MANSRQEASWGSWISIHLLVVAAIGFILLSVIVDLTAALHGAKLTKEEMIQDLEGIQFFSIHTAAGLLRELGFAAGIAWIIAITIERVSRAQEMARFEASRAAIALDVFQAVIGSFAPEEIRDLALRTVLLANIHRPSARLSFTLRPMTAGYGDLSNRYVLLEGNLNYEIVNTGATEIEHYLGNVSLYIPKR